MNSSTTNNDLLTPNSEDISYEVIQMSFFVLNDIAVPIISMFGAVANIINIIVYIKLGVNDSSNLSFLVLAISDFLNVISGLTYAIFCSSLWTIMSDLTFDPQAIGYMVAGWPRAVFSKMTCCITVFITIERCLCISSPLKVKSILTTERTLMVLLSLLVACFLFNYIHIYTGAFYLSYNLDPSINRTVLGVGVSDKYGEVNAISGFLNTTSFIALFGILVASAAVLTFELRRKSQWRKSLANSKSSKLEEMSKREKAVSVTIAVLAFVLILTYFSYAVNCVLSVVMEEGVKNGKYSYILQIIWIISFTTETINSSTSIFVYYKMSSQYKKTFQLVIVRHFRVT